MGFYVHNLTRRREARTPPWNVKPGASLARVAAELQQRGIVKSADALRAIMRFRGSAANLRDGLYDFTGDMSAFEVADTLARPGRPRIVTVTIPEGKRLKDLPGIIEKAGLGSAQALRTALNDVKASPYARKSLEGFLYPATYPFRPEASPQEIVRALTERMNREFTPERIEKATKLGLDVYGWVTLASMVQAEAGHSGEMALIAGVFLNRLELRMTLGSDPTVAYGLGKDLPQLNRYEGDFTRDTPYNTYTRAGLPQGPINNPGQEALLAVLNPQRSVNGKDALYFLHGKKGEFRVNATYAAHLRDIAQYR